MIQGIHNTYEPVRQNEIKKQTSDEAFKGALDAAKMLLNATNEAEQVTNELTYDFMTGKNENIHGLMVAQEKSSILLQFTMQVRNNVLEAYREIMRMPV
ncbi:MAG: flagellar hook-basal body complex protein FliE [Cellulosilyticaceae bacterium]